MLPFSSVGWHNTCSHSVPKLPMESIHLGFWGRSSRTGTSLNISKKLKQIGMVIMQDQQLWHTLTHEYSQQKREGAKKKEWRKNNFWVENYLAFSKPTIKFKTSAFWFPWEKKYEKLNLNGLWKFGGIHQCKLLHRVLRDTSNPHTAAFRQFFVKFYSCPNYPKN